MAKPSLPLYNFKVKLDFSDQSGAQFGPDALGGPHTVEDFTQRALPFLLEGAAILRSAPIKINITATLVEEKL